MSLADIIISIVLLVLVAVIIGIMIRNKQKGKGGCSCGCNGCPSTICKGRRDSGDKANTTVDKSETQ